MPKILIFSASTRAASLNRKLAALAARIAQDNGAQATLIDLKDYEMPLYNGDLEDAHGLPEAARRLKEVFLAHDGLFIASPEYNSSMSPLLVNTLDWVSRKEGKDEKVLSAYQGKTAALGAVSPGALGGLRGLVPLRMMLGNLGVTVVPKQVAVSSGSSAFDATGALTEARQAAMLEAAVQQLITTTRALSGAV